MERRLAPYHGAGKSRSDVTNPVDVADDRNKDLQLETALQAVQSLPRCIVPLLNGVDHVEVLRAHFWP